MLSRMRMSPSGDHNKSESTSGDSCHHHLEQEKHLLPSNSESTFSKGSLRSEMNSNIGSKHGTGIYVCYRIEKPKTSCEYSSIAISMTSIGLPRHMMEICRVLYSKFESRLKVMDPLCQHEVLNLVLQVSYTAHWLVTYLSKSVFGHTVCLRSRLSLVEIGFAAAWDTSLGYFMRIMHPNMSLVQQHQNEIGWGGELDVRIESDQLEFRALWNVSS
ncbi:hypothetical protein Tco_0290448 [Tanacetum coccineum]